MNISKLTVWAVSLATAATLGGVGLAAGPDAGQSGGPRRGLLARAAARLQAAGVTAEQRQQIREVLRKHLSEVGPLVRQQIDARRDLRNVIRKSPVDEKAIREQAAKVAAIEADLAVKRAHIVSEAKPILTEDQIQQLLSMESAAQERIDQGLQRLAQRLSAE